MKKFRKLMLVNKYRVEKSREPNDHGNYILRHITKTLRGCNYQRVFKGSFKECHAEKKRLERLRLEEVYK